jgi:hypothetical protein
MAAPSADLTGLAPSASPLLADARPAVTQRQVKGPMPSTKGDIKDFVLAVCSEWLTLLSGPLSVPVAVAAFFVPNDIAKILFGLIAFIGVWVTAYRLWKREHDKVVEHDREKRELLDDIAALREKVGDYRIDMEFDHSAGRFNQNAWQKKYDILETEIASKIEQLSSKAEARTYLYRGNLQRPINIVRPVLIDISIRDLDYLQAFIHAYSRRD